MRHADAPETTAKMKNKSSYYEQWWQFSGNGSVDISVKLIKKGI